MMLERQPTQTRLIESGIKRCRQEVTRTWKWAKEQLAQVKYGPFNRIFQTKDHNINTTSPNIPRKRSWNPPDGTTHTTNESNKTGTIFCCPRKPKANFGHCKDLIPFKKSPALPPKGRTPPHSSSCSLAPNQKTQEHESGHSRGKKSARTSTQIPPHSIRSVRHNQKRQNDKSGDNKGAKKARTLPKT